MPLPCITHAVSPSRTLRPRTLAPALFLLPALLGCPAPPPPVHPRPHATAAGPQTELERRAWLLFEDRCLVESGPPCAWSDELADGAAALAELLRREGLDALRREPVVRDVLQRAGIGHPNTLSAALYYHSAAPSPEELDAFVAGVTWPFAARAYGLAEAAVTEPASGDEAPAPGLLVVVGAEPLVELDPLPRWLPQEASVTFFGRVLFPAESLELLLADPAGTIRQAPLMLDDEAGFDGSVHVGPASGRWTFELVAQDERRGPQVIYLLPIELSLHPPAPPNGGGVAGPGTTELAAAVDVMTELVLAFRAERGLGTLARDPALDGVAQTHADDMAAGGFLGHVSPTRGNLEDRLRAAGVTWPRAAENLALAPSAEDAFANLLASPAHRANFLEPGFTRLGVAAARQGESLVFAIELAAER
jgi:uncharacterized protein YkwD